MADKEFDIKKEYEQLSKKYSLPVFDLLNNEFEISSIDKHEFLLRNIRRKISEKLDLFGKIVENIVHPTEQSIVSMYEGSFFNEQEKKSMEKLHKELLVYEKSSLLLDINSSDDKEAHFIMDLFNNWNKIKSNMEGIVKNMKDNWSEENLNEKEDEGGKYFG